MKAFAKDIATVVLPGRRRSWKAREAARERAARTERELVHEYRGLAELPLRTCRTEKLRAWNQPAFEQYLAHPDRRAEWDDVQAETERFDVPAMKGGVNPGDQRLIYHLVRYLQPERVLEVGTHLGSSTLHVAAALKRNAGEDRPPRVTSVDLRDVNCPDRRPWREFGSHSSPREMVREIGCGEWIEFVASDSVEFLERTDDTYDFVFLDGDHSAQAVYREIPLALERLSPGGVILLHDYFPNLEPLWPSDANGAASTVHPAVIPGVYLAVQRLQREGNDLHVQPFGELPWPTKLGTHVTSLALLARRG